MTARERMEIGRLKGQVTQQKRANNNLKAEVRYLRGKIKFLTEVGRKTLEGGYYGK